MFDQPWSMNLLSIIQAVGWSVLATSIDKCGDRDEKEYLDEMILQFDLQSYIIGHKFDGHKFRRTNVRQDFVI